MCPPVTTIMVFRQLVNLGTRCTVTYCRKYWAMYNANKECFRKKLSTKLELKVPLWSKMWLLYLLHISKVKVLVTYHAKFQVEIPTVSPIALTLNFVLEPIFLSAITGFKNNREETDLTCQTRRNTHSKKIQNYEYMN